MANQEIIKEYDREGITVIWQPRKCIHSEVCVNTLPSVYRPNEKPWIIPENASVEDLVSQIDRCPSGALSYKLSEQRSKTKTTNMSQKVEVTPTGP